MNNKNRRKKVNKKRSRAGRVFSSRMSRALLFALMICAFFLPNYTKVVHSGNNFFKITLNGVYVGAVGEESEIDQCLREARKSIVIGSNELVFMESELQVEASEVFFGDIDAHGKVVANMINVLNSSLKKHLARAYTVKVNQETINLKNSDEVLSFLNQTINPYDTKSQYDATLVLEPWRELTVLTPIINNIEKVEEEAIKEEETKAVLATTAGVESFLTSNTLGNDYEGEVDFRDFDYGLTGLSYDGSIEVVETYLPQEELIEVEEAVDKITQNQEVQQIYTVASGDTLSSISYATNISMENLVAMNPSILSTVSSMLHIGDQLVITVPEPELSVIWTENKYVEENYEADIIYIDNDNWYTTQTKTIQEPVQGFRKTVSRVTYKNNKVLEKEIIYEEIVTAAVPKMIERGTKIPPTYVKPLNGGHFTSGFGGRKAPTKGASSNHKGIDWACPMGTNIYASCGGKVVKAGWGKGYGYVVYIDHPDGRQTRYAHLSKVLVNVGDYVSQGTRIALSGSSGVSTGPHLHFEMLINGTHVNPMNYLN